MSTWNNPSRPTGTSYSLREFVGGDYLIDSFGDYLVDSFGDFLYDSNGPQYSQRPIITTTFTTR